MGRVGGEVREEFEPCRAHDRNRAFGYGFRGRNPDKSAKAESSSGSLYAGEGGQMRAILGRVLRLGSRRLVVAEALETKKRRLECGGER